jgi:hypothetical protein
MQQVMQQQFTPAAIMGLMRQMQKSMRPRYQVKPLGEAEVERTVYTSEENGKDKHGNKKYKPVATKVKKTVMRYMVFFPAGHSVVVTEPELIRLGFHNPSDLVDMETGEKMLGMPSIDLEAHSKSMTSATKRMM